MAYKLFDALNRAARTFRGAPDPRDISRQMQSNLDRRDARVRFQGFRRMQGRPGVRGPYGFTAGRTAPISPQAAAQFVSGKLGTQYAPELNRLTAPDPMTLARGARAPEFADIDLRTGAAGARFTEAEAGTLEAKLPTVPERERAEIAGLTGTESRAQAEAEARIAGQETETQLAAKGLAPEVVRQENMQQFIAQLDSMIEDAREDGDYKLADELRQQQRDLMTGKEDVAAMGGYTGEGAPDRTPPGGAPPIVSPVRLAREQLGDEAVMQRYGFTDDWLKSIRGGLFGTGAFKLGYGQTNTKLEQLVSAIKTAPPEYAAAIIRKIRPNMSRLQILKQSPQSPIKSEREAAALVAELEELVAFGEPGGSW